jgi:hypothetical protein
MLVAKAGRGGHEGMSMDMFADLADAPTSQIGRAAAHRVRFHADSHLPPAVATKMECMALQGTTKANCFKRGAFC